MDLLHKPILSTTGRRAWLYGSMVVLAIIGGWFITQNLVDFPVYYDGGRSLLAGRTDLYSGDFARGMVMDYRYPPLFLLLFAPLSLLPYQAAAFTWYLTGLAEIIGSAIILARTVRINTTAVVATLTALATAQYFVMTLHYGNAHLLAVFLMFGSIFFLSKGQHVRSAALMGLAITIKLTPAVLLPYFAIRRRWRFLVLLVAVLVALNLAPAAYFGWQKNADLLGTWYRHVIGDQEFHEANGPINLSLKGQVTRYLTEVDYSRRVNGDIDYPAVNVVNLSTATAHKIWFVVAVGIFALGLGFVLWRSKKNRVYEQGTGTGTPSIDALEVGLMIGVMLLVEPLTSKIYFISLAWPVFFLAHFANRRSTREQRAVWFILIAIACANALLPLLPGRRLQRFLLVAGIDFYVNAGLILATCLALWPGRSQIRTSNVEPRTESP